MTFLKRGVNIPGTHFVFLLTSSKISTGANTYSCSKNLSYICLKLFTIYISFGFHKQVNNFYWLELNNIDLKDMRFQKDGAIPDSTKEIIQ